LGVNAQTYRGGSAGTSKTIEQQVFKRLIGLPYYGVFDHITFQVENGTVILGGKVNSLGTRNQAASAVKDIAGVRRVVNNIEQLPPSGFDDSIRRQALRSFSSSGLGRYFYENDPEVRIIVENGRLTLEGYVANRGDSDLLNILANGVTNVFQVTNNLIVGKDRRR
jgi:osmotically-inducible protein OsmY